MTTLPAADERPATVAAETSRAATPADELSLLIDGAVNYAIYMLDPEGRVTIWNRGAERIKGWTEAEIVGRHFSTFYPPEDVSAGKPEEDLARANASGRIEENSWRVRKDGSEFLASVTITALHDETGALRGFGKVIRDITDQQAAESALEQREQHLRSILATVPDAMIVTDAGGLITSFSTAAERLFGYVEEDVVGLKISMLMPNTELNRHNDHLKQVTAVNEAAAAQDTRLVTGLRRNGETFPIELAVGEALSGGERIFTGFVRDVGERQRTEVRMQELRSELIHVSRLSAMGTMASTLAHELNQPLTAVANYLETTRDMLDAPDARTIPLVRDALNEAAAQSLRAGQIVRRLREFVARGDVEQRAEPLGELVREAAVLGLIGAREAGIVVTVSIDTEADNVTVDRIQVQQVLINLFRNAIQAMKGVSRRYLEISTASEGSDFLRVTVADTGPGLDAHVRNRLFQAFTTTKEDGMGLGLSICRTIIETHGGRIWVSEGSEVGTAFHFTLRRTEPEKADVG